MAKAISYSSSRTAFFQIILPIIGFSFIYKSIILIINFNNGNQLFFSIFALLIGFVALVLGLKIKSLKNDSGNLIFSSINGKKDIVHIDNVLIYAIKQFSLAGMDILSLNRFSIIKCQVGKNNKSFLVLNPSKMSSYSDIEKLLKEIKLKQGTKK